MFVCLLVCSLVCLCLDHGDDDDEVTDCEEVNLRGRTRTNAPSESLTAADWLKRALSEHDDEDEDDSGNGFGEDDDDRQCSDNDFDDDDNDGYGHGEDDEVVKGNGKKTIVKKH